MNQKLIARLKDRGGLYILLSTAYAEYIADKAGFGFIQTIVNFFKQICI